ncbi:hypothetical protein AALB53_14670 [Lachnospiraceae bacterium 47-T17]
MKWLKRIGVAIISLPLLLILAVILFEIFGMCVNHAATRRQTHKLKENLTASIPDIKILDVSSQTGNSSGTGNHVDCVSLIAFTTALESEEIQEIMSEFYNFDEWYCFIEKVADGSFYFYLNTPAPFADNIEGH